VTFTGNGTSGATFGHGLSSAPKMVIFKCRNTAYDWLVYHASLGNTALIALNTTAAQQTGRGDFLNSTTPSNSLITLGNTAGVNESSKTYVAYCFAEIAGYSKFGSYVGNGSADGPFVYCGFRPRYVCVKRTDVASDWHLYDTARDIYNQSNLVLKPNLAGAESSPANTPIDFLSNGFKLRGTDAGTNGSANNFIFMAFAETPFNYSRAR
jgi:hypothetical protein